MLAHKSHCCDSLRSPFHVEKQHSRCLTTGRCVVNARSRQHSFSKVPWQQGIISHNKISKDYSCRAESSSLDIEYIHPPQEGKLESENLSSGVRKQVLSCLYTPTAPFPLRRLFRHTQPTLRVFFIIVHKAQKYLAPWRGTVFSIRTLSFLAYSLSMLDLLPFLFVDMDWHRQSYGAGGTSNNNYNPMYVQVQEAVEGLGGRVTVGDVAAMAGVRIAEAEEALNALAADCNASIQVNA